MGQTAFCAAERAVHPYSEPHLRAAGLFSGVLRCKHPFLHRRRAALPEVLQFRYRSYSSVLPPFPVPLYKKKATIGSLFEENFVQKFWALCCKNQSLIVENFSLENDSLNGLCCLRLVYRKTLQQPPEFLPAQAPHLCFCPWPLKAARLYTLIK